MDFVGGDFVWAFIKSADQIATVEAAARAGRIGGIWLLRSKMTSQGATGDTAYGLCSGGA